MPHPPFTGSGRSIGAAKRQVSQGNPLPVGFVGGDPFRAISFKHTTFITDYMTVIAVI